VQFLAAWRLHLNGLRQNAFFRPNVYWTLN
jgi:hypothetical protein